MWGSAEPSGWEHQEGGRPLRTFEGYRDSGQKWNREVPKKTPLRVRDLSVCLGLQCGCSTTWEGSLGKKRLERQWTPWEGLTCVGRRTRLFGWPVESLRLCLDEPPVRLGEQQRRGSGQPRAVGRGPWPGVAGVDAWEGCRQWQLGVRTEQVTGQAEVSTQLSLSYEVEGAGGKPCGTGTSRGHLRAGAEMWDESLSRDGDKLTKTMESTSVQSHGY